MTTVKVVLGFLELALAFKFLSNADLVGNWGIFKREMTQSEQKPIRVPITAIYTRADGVVAWQACIDGTNPDVEHVEVRATHTGLTLSPEVLRMIAHRLAPGVSRQRRERLAKKSRAA